MQISKWGNSLAVRIPAAIVEVLDLKEGDDIEIRVPSERTFELVRKPSRKEMVDRLKKFGGQIPSDFRFDRDFANER
jgi:antitoxin MazE